NEFAATQTRPAATTAAVSTISGMVADKVAAHQALRGVESKPAPGGYKTVDDSVAALESTARPTYQTADAIDKQERDAWEAQKKTAVDAHKAAITEHNKRVL